MYYSSFIYKCNKLTNVIYSLTNAMNTFINVLNTFTNVINIFIIVISKFGNEFITFTYINKTFIDVNLKTCTNVIAICTTTNIINFPNVPSTTFSVVNNTDTNIIKTFTIVIMSLSNVIETFSLNVNQPPRIVVQTFTNIIFTFTNVITTCTNVISTVTNVIATLVM